jgi:RNA polymerase sigma-70 factor (ECF subfamily)
MEMSWLEPYADQLGTAALRESPEARYASRESLELAFVAALQYLTPHQRAVLVMREVVGFSAIETAEALDTTVGAVNSALQRARAAAAARLPERSQQAVLQSLGDGQVRALAERYADAIERSDIDGLCSMLTEDATWSMPPHPHWYRGHAAIAEFHVRDVSAERWRHLASRANGQLAVGCYIYDADCECFIGSVLDVLTLEGDRIAAVTAFFTAAAFRNDGDIGERFVGAVSFPRFGLPETLPARED